MIDWLIVNGNHAIQSDTSDPRHFGRKKCGSDVSLSGHFGPGTEASWGT